MTAAANPAPEAEDSRRVTEARPADEAGWVLCPDCTMPVYGRRLARDLRVCGQCGRHLPLTAEQRLVQLADGGHFEELRLVTGGDDPIDFVDVIAYTTRLARARAHTGMDEAVLCARATIHDNPAILVVLDFRFMGGSLGTVAGDLITQAIETALAERTPLVIVTSSGGARMQEGALALMQMAKTSAALAQLDEAGILSISLIADPTFGGVAASFATLTDVVVAEPRARFGFVGRRVIEQTIGQELPPEFQTAEFLLERGFIDMIVPRSRQREELGKLLRLGCPFNRSAIGLGEEPCPVVRDPGRLAEPDPWDQVARARHLDRPTAMEYFHLAFEGFQELHGDRISGECRAVVGGTAWLHGRPVVVIGHQKGHTATELVSRNFGMPSPAGFRKAARLMRLAAKLRLPVVTLVDTPGAHPGAEAEERGQAVAIAENLRLMASLEVPVVCVVIGEGGSGGALALAVANRVLVLSGSIYSVISPEGCAAIIWKDPSAGPEAAAALRLTPRDLLCLGIVDGVVPEPDGGARALPVVAADRLRAAVSHALAELVPLDASELRASRRARFRQFGSAAIMEGEGTTNGSPRPPLVVVEPA